MASVKAYKGARDRWRVVVDVGRDPITRKRRRIAEVVEGTKTRANERARELEAAHARKAPTTKGITVGEVLERYYEARRYLPGVGDTWAPKTTLGYRQRLDGVLIPALGELPLSELDARRLDALYVELQRKGRPGAKRPRPLSARTVRLAHQLLACAIDDAVRYGEAGENVARQARVPRAPKLSDERAKRGIPTTEQIRAVLEVAEHGIEGKGADRDLADLAYLALALGRRLGELCGIRWADVDLEAGTVRVQRTISADETRELVVLEDSRRKSPAVTLSIDAATVGRLRGRRARAREAALAFGVRLDERAAYVFAQSVDGRAPVAPDRMSERWRRLVRRAGVAKLDTGESFRFHDLRHWTVSMLIARGLDLQAAAAQAGHVDLTTTGKLYSHVIPERDTRASEILGVELGKIAELRPGRKAAGE